MSKIREVLLSNAWLESEVYTGREFLRLYQCGVEVVAEQAPPVRAALGQRVEEAVTQHDEALVPLGELGRPRPLVFGALVVAHTAHADGAPVAVRGEAVLGDVRMGDDD